MIAACEHIPYKIAGVPQNLFALAQNGKQTVALTSTATTSSSSQVLENAATPADIQSTLHGSTEIRLLPLSTPSSSKLQPDTIANKNNKQLEEEKGDHADDQSSVQNPESAETTVKVWIKLLGNYSTDPGNFRNMQMHAEGKAEIVRHGLSKPVNVVFAKDGNSRSLQQSW